MSDASNGGGRAKGSNPDAGVLANLPRTRPQRTSARRTAARNAVSAPAKATRTAAKAKRKAPAKSAIPAPAATAKRTSARTSPANAVPKGPKAKRATRATGGREETVPRQGYEVDGEIASGSVQPPGAAELVSSAAELAGELAKAGVSGGARLLKDLFARLPPG